MNIEQKVFEDMLKAKGVPFQYWGKPASRTKSVQNLFNEVNNREVQLEFRDDIGERGTFIRVITSVEAVIYCDLEAKVDIVHRLAEIRQHIHHNGSAHGWIRDRRERSTISIPVPDGSDAEEVLRAYLHKLCRTIEPCTIVKDDRTQTQTLPSESYPGIYTRRTKLLFAVKVPPSCYRPYEIPVSCPAQSMTIVYRWRPTKRKTVLTYFEEKPSLVAAW